MSRSSIFLAALGGIPFVVGWTFRPRQGRDALAQLEKARQAEQAAIRRIRLASQDLRTIGLNLQGIADHLATPGPALASDLTVVATAVFDIADDLHEFSMQAGPAHVLHDEQLNLAALLDGAVTDVANAIRPGRREWRIDPSVSPTLLTADRRALRYVLTRVLIVLVRSTGPGGAIDIGLAPRDGGLALVVAADASNPVAGIEASLTGEEGNAIEARLALAHTLIRAHGGRLELELRPGAAVKAALIFPRARLVEAAHVPP